MERPAMAESTLVRGTVMVKRGLVKLKMEFLGLDQMIDGEKKEERREEEEEEPRGKEKDKKGREREGEEQVTCACYQSQADKQKEEKPKVMDVIPRPA
jgi:hypothetical protein